ncbi:MAG: nuclear transport factor 2 family protein [Bacteroidota bacterium]
MNTQEVAKKLVALCRENKNMEAINSLYADNIVSLEPAGAPAERVEGLEAVRAKTTQFFEQVEEFHGWGVSDPVVAGKHFSVSMDMDVTFKGQGRVKVDEICVYEVENGKIVKEQFFFPVGPA